MACFYILLTLHIKPVSHCCGLYTIVTNKVDINCFCLFAGIYVHRI